MIRWASGGPRIRLAVVVSLLATPWAAAWAGQDGAALVGTVWERYRSVRSEREESEIFVISNPKAARFSRTDAEGFARETRDDVVHKRAVRHTLYAPDRRDKLHILFSLPAEDAGLGFLVWRQPDTTRDDMWLYMPGYHEVRRIPVSSHQRLAGTDLLYEDVRELAGERTERFTYEMLAADTVDGRACDVVQATPKEGTSTAYGSRKTWIDKEWLFPLQVEFYDDAGTLWKVFRNAEIREVAPNIRRADLAEMRDLKANQSTILLVTRRAVGVEIPAQVFTADYLARPGAD